MFAITIPHAVKKPTVAGGFGESNAVSSADLSILGSTIASTGAIGEPREFLDDEFVRLSESAAHGILTSR